MNAISIPLGLEAYTLFIAYGFSVTDIAFACVTGLTKTDSF